MGDYRRLVVDIDGTLCEETGGLNYADAPPRQNVIAQVNRFYDAGYDVTIFTARGMYRYAGDRGMIEENLRPVTEAWLKRHGVRYHRLWFGKPSSDMYIDDKAVTPEDFLEKKWGT